MPAPATYSGNGKGGERMRFFVLGKRGLAGVLALICVCAVAAVVTGRLGRAAYVDAKGREIPIYSVDTQEKRAAIGFNCAWGDEDVPLILAALEQYNVRATFFVVGQWAEEHPESVRAIAQAGHELGNHSYSHPDMTALSREDIAAQITRCNEAVRAITGKAPTLFRAPSGAYNNAVVETARALGCHSVQWDVDSRDWKNPAPDEMTSRVLKNVQPGSILLFHVGKENTDAALPEILRGLQGMGYTLCPVGELIYTENYRVDAAGRQFAARETHGA